MDIIILFKIVCNNMLNAINYLYLVNYITQIHNVENNFYLHPGYGKF